MKEVTSICVNDLRLEGDTFYLSVGMHNFCTKWSSLSYMEIMEKPVTIDEKSNMLSPLKISVVLL